MTLLRGTEARAALLELLNGARLPAAIVLDPGLARGSTLRVLALATPMRAVVIDPVGLSPDVVSAVPVLAAYDAKNAHRALLRHGWKPPSRWACLRICEQLLAGGRPGGTSFNDIALRLGLESPADPASGLEGLQAHARDVARVMERQVEELRRDGLGMVSKLEAAALPAIAELEHHGMALDVHGWRALHEAATKERDELEAQLAVLLEMPTSSDLFGRPASTLSNDDSLRAALARQGYTLRNLRRETLAQLPAPLGATLGRYRELGKLVTAYGTDFLEHVRADGRVHPVFDQIGASTGRMACHTPNLQAIPTDAPYRTCFRAPLGRTLVTADYATCELRILAEMSGDPVFREAFVRNEDVHARVATEVFGQTVSKTQNAELRHRAKAVSFGLVYGMGAHGLARAIDAPIDQAERLLERYFVTFPKIRTFLVSNAETALRRGHAVTLLGRRLYLDPSEERSQLERVARNMPIQGTSADITKLALARVRTALESFDQAFLVNAVHDELVVECHDADGPAVAEVIREAMMAAGRDVLPSIPTAVDTRVGPTWGH